MRYAPGIVTTRSVFGRVRALCLLPFFSLLLWIGALSRPAEAHKRNFAWSYEWLTPFMGERELELWLTSEDEGETWETWLEYEFSVNRRHAMGFYLTRDQHADGGLDANGWKWENRYRFGEFDTDAWLHAAYLELAKERGESYELEAKWLLSRYNPRGDALAFNLIAERALGPEADVEWGATLGWNRKVSERWRLGAEVFGEFEDREWFLGPDMTYDSSSNTRVVAGLGFGLTRESHDLVMRVIGEYEW